MDQNLGKFYTKARAPSIGFYDSGHRPGAVLGTQPTRDGHGEAAGGAAGDQDVELFERGELRNHHARGGWGLAVAKVGALAVIFIGEQLAVGAADRLAEVAPEIGSGPAVVGERPGVLGADDEQRVRIEREVLAVPEVS